MTKKVIDGIQSDSLIEFGLNGISREIRLLKKYHNSKNTISHSITVAKLSVKIVEEIKRKNPKFKLNIKEIKTGALLHDIDKYLTLKKNYKKALTFCKNLGIKKKKTEHGILGAEILRKEGLGEYANYCLKHSFYQVLCYKKMKIWIKRYSIEGSDLKKLKRALEEFKKIEEEIISKTGLNKKEFYKKLRLTLKNDKGLL
jgi:putative nucleotidyltransferase with HDIG domain